MPWSSSFSLKIPEMFFLKSHILIGHFKNREPRTWVYFLRISITFMGNLLSAHFFSPFHPVLSDGFTGRTDTDLLPDGTLFLYLTCLKLRGSVITNKNPTSKMRSRNTSKWHQLIVLLSSSLLHLPQPPYKYELWFIVEYSRFSSYSWNFSTAQILMEINA